MGPTCSGINVRNFVIMHRDSENAMGQLNSSAQFGKMSVDFYYEEIDKGAKGGGVYVVTLFVEGQAVADAKGSKKGIKTMVAKKALDYLRTICYTVVLNNKDGKIDRRNIMSRNDVKRTSEFVSQENKDKSFGDFGSKMLEQMGWKEGESLGVSGDSASNIREPVTVNLIALKHKNKDYFGCFVVERECQQGGSWIPSNQR